MLNTGDKILVSHRRLFDEDQPRYFVGEVVGYDAGVVMVSGYSWVREPFSGGCSRKDDRRTKVLSLTSGSVLAYRLPESLDVGELRIELADEHSLTLTDGQAFRMDLTERLPRPRQSRVA
jgi:hypothetical protein